MKKILTIITVVLLLFTSNVSMVNALAYNENLKNDDLNSNSENLDVAKEVNDPEELDSIDDNQTYAGCSYYDYDKEGLEIAIRTDCSLSIRKWHSGDSWYIRAGIGKVYDRVSNVKTLIIRGNDWKQDIKPADIIKTFEYLPNLEKIVIQGTFAYNPDFTAMGSKASTFVLDSGSRASDFTSSFKNNKFIKNLEVNTSSALPDNMFHASTLENLNANNNITSVGNYTFQGSNLKSINRAGGGSITSIGNLAFNNTKLEYIYLPKITSVGDSAFLASSTLELIEVSPSTNTSIFNNKLSYMTTVSPTINKDLPSMKLLEGDAFEISGEKIGKDVFQISGSSQKTIKYSWWNGSTKVQDGELLKVDYADLNKNSYKLEIEIAGVKILTATTPLDITPYGDVVIEGIEDTQIVQGTNLDLLEGVKAIDGQRNDVTNTLKANVVTKSIDTMVPGSYVVTYTATDLLGREYSFDREVIVNPYGDTVIKGIESLTLTQGSNLDLLEGVNAIDGQGNDVTSTVVLSDTVDTMVPGEYIIRYTVTDLLDREFTFDRIITIAPFGDSIVNGLEDLNLLQGDEYDLLEGIEAIDGQGNIITSSILIDENIDSMIPGTYIVTYTVTDSIGRDYSFERTVIVAPYGDPTLEGVDDLTILQGDSLNLLEGVIAADGQGNDVSTNVEIEGQVHPSIPGAYTIKYLVTDLIGRVFTFERTITVNPYGDTTLEGLQDLTVLQGSSVDLLGGVIAIDGQDIDVTSSLTLSQEIDTMITGNYIVVYTATDKLGREFTFERNITVAPYGETTIEGIDNLNILQGDSVDLLEGVIALDGQGNDVSESITLVEDLNTMVAGEYSIKYSAIDLLGRSFTFERIITVSPYGEINASGLDNVELDINGEFNPLTGVTIIDGQGIDVTDLTLVNGNVDTSKAGTYTLTYVLFDKIGNSKEITREVVVKDSTIEVDNSNALPSTGKSNFNPIPLLIAGLVLVGISKKKKKEEETK